ncbi:unnamed protein product [Rotaria sordida]|uniref:Uncharacterized protein n=1 Tax=Rotaria sordida TaxID=392033 RepID=A0A818VC98_9BILA|nr:unnamed protein product [Rotaria sordida]CAF3710598.1 unnamed protein product [Rotaria sordida]
MLLNHFKNENCQSSIQENGHQLLNQNPIHKNNFFCLHHRLMYSNHRNITYYIQESLELNLNSNDECRDDYEKNQQQLTVIDCLL